MDFVKEIRIFCAQYDLKPRELLKAAGLGPRTWDNWVTGYDRKQSSTDKVRAEMARIKAKLGAV